MDDDFNTPKAISELFELVNIGNKILEKEELNKDDKKTLGYIRFYLEECGNIFGLIMQFSETVDNGLAIFIDKKIKERNKARSDKDFAKADKVREELLAKGVILEDAKNGTHWRKI